MLAVGADEHLLGISLNLNGPTPPRVQPGWASGDRTRCRTTKQKKRMRIWVGLVLLGAMIAIFLLGWYVYHAMTGSWGFGIGDEEQLIGDAPVPALDG